MTDKFSNKINGTCDDGRGMGDAGCGTGVSDTYGVGSGGLASGLPEREGFGGRDSQRGDGTEPA